MAWRAPRFGLLHAARLAGPGSLSAPNALGSGSLDHLLDDRAGFFAEFATAETDHTIILDRGAGTLEAIDRLWIPAGHNLDGVDIRVRAATDAAITTGVVTLLASTPVSGSDAIDETLASSSLRFVELAFLTSSAPRVSELVYTRTRTTLRGPEADWEDDPLDHTSHLETESGAVYHLIRGPDGRRMSLSYVQAVDADDLVLLEDLFALGTGAAFVLDPPYDDEPARWVTLTERSRRNDNPTPASTPKRVSYEFEAETVLA